MLGRWEPAHAEPPRQDVAERLSQWLSVRDAITLDAAHRAIQALPAPGAPRRAGARAATSVATEVQRARATLVQAVLAAPAPVPAPRRGRHPLPLAGAEAATASEPGFESEFAPWRQRHLDLQRQMDLRIDALRVFARQQLSGASPDLAQLAAMDAVMDKMLAERTQKALSALPAVLERRCLQLHRQGAGGPDAWGRELQDVLLAELEWRLEPVVGLMEAGSRSGEAVGNYQ